MAPPDAVRRSRTAHQDAVTSTDTEIRANEPQNPTSPPARWMPVPLIVSDHSAKMADQALTVWTVLFKELSAERDNAAQRHNELLPHLESLHTELDACDSKQKATQAEVNNLNNRLKDTELDLLDVTGQLTDCQKSEKSMERELLQSRIELQACRVESMSRFDAMKKLQSHVDSLHQRLEEAAAYHKDLERQLEVLKAELDRERSSNSDLQATLKASEEKQAEMQASNIQRDRQIATQEQAFLEQLKKIGSRIAGLEDENRQYKQRNEQLHIDNVQLLRQNQPDAARDKAAQLRNQRQTDTSSAQKDKEMDSLRKNFMKSCDDYMRMKNERDALSKKVEQLQSDLNRHCDISAEQTAALKKKDITIEELQTGNKENADKITKLEARYAEFLNTIRNLEAKNADYLAEKNAFKAINPALVAAIETTLEAQRPRQGGNTISAMETSTTHAAAPMLSAPKPTSDPRTTDANSSAKLSKLAPPSGPASINPPPSTVTQPPLHFSNHSQIFGRSTSQKGHFDTLRKEQKVENRSSGSEDLKVMGMASRDPKGMGDVQAPAGQTGGKRQWDDAGQFEGVRARKRRREVDSWRPA